LRLIFFSISLLSLFISCKEINNDNNSIQSDTQIAFKSFFGQDNISEIYHLDSLYSSEFQKWSDFVTLLNLFKEMCNDDDDHRIMISALFDKSNNIDIKKIPTLFNTAPIIGRTKVLKTFIEKVFFSVESEFSSKEYKKDIEKILDSFNALIYQLNARAKEISF